MNIFFISTSPQIAATHMCDQHVIKMILESLQLLSTAVRISYQEAGEKLPKALDEVLLSATHVNHPSSIWTRASRQNYAWLLVHTFHLNREKKARWNSGDHATFVRTFEVLKREICKKHLPKETLTVPTLAIRDDYRLFAQPPKTWSQVVMSYKYYYAQDKLRFGRWTNCKPPFWLVRAAARKDFELTSTNKGTPDGKIVYRFQ